eukprot:495037-Prymnesium_polylepis.1
MSLLRAYAAGTVKTGSGLVDRAASTRSWRFSSPGSLAERFPSALTRLQRCVPSDSQRQLGTGGCGSDP